jgi:anthranilate phosphoribosyltransferase
MVQLACGGAVPPLLVDVVGPVGDGALSLPLHPAATAAAIAAAHKLTRVMHRSLR